MKQNKLLNLLMVLVLIAIMFASCKKDNSTSSTVLTNQQTEQVQNSDVQDAVADRTDQDVDNSLDGLQANNYSVPDTKGAGALTINVGPDAVDSLSPPSTVSLTYSSYQDSTSGETFIKNGVISVGIAIGKNVKYTTRTITYHNFSIQTDSTIIIINGTRTVTRDSLTYKFNALKGIRIYAKDAISANLSYALVTIGLTDTLKFTRIVTRTRSTVLYFINLGSQTSLAGIDFVNVPSLDTIKWTGTVTGLDEAGDNYSRTIQDTMVCQFYKGTPYLSAGQILSTTTGKHVTSYTFIYQEDMPNYPRLTLVTVKNNNTKEIHTFVRTFYRKFLIWW